MCIVDEEDVARLDRRLLVVEQLMRAASVDPNGQPFTIVESSQFYHGVAELIVEAREALRALQDNNTRRLVRLRSG